MYMSAFCLFLTEIELQEPFFNQGAIEKKKTGSDLKMKTGSRLIRTGFSIAIVITI
jgi:hypothetical protein